MRATGRAYKVGPGTQRDQPARGPVVTGVGPDGFRIGDTSFKGVFLTPERAIGWDDRSLADLRIEDLEPALGLEPPPDFLILGTGESMAFAPAGLKRALEARGIGVESMDSRAAARTWGILRAEERWIAAALLPIGPSE